MFNAGAVVGQLRLDMQGWTANVRRGVADTRDLKAKLGDLGNSAREMAIPFAAAGAAITLAMRKIRQEAMRVEESENLFVVSMGNMAASTRAWSEELSSAIGMNASSIREQVSTLNVMLDSMGMTENGAASLSKEMTKLAYDMASFYNLDVQQAFDKIRSGISGEMEPLKRLGIILSETTVQQWAWRNGLAATGQQLTEQQKVLARFGSLMEQTGKAQGDMARTSESATNQQRRFQETFLALRQELGKASAAASGPWYGAASKAMQAATAWAKENQALAGSLSRLAQASGYAMIGFAGIAFAGPTIARTFRLIAVSASAAWAAIMAPITIVVASIAAVGAAAYVLRAEFKQNLHGIKNDWQDVVNFFAKGLGLLSFNFRGFFDSVRKGFRDLFNGIIGGWMGINASINSLMKNMFDPDGLNKALDAGVAAANQDYFGKIVGYVKTDFQATWMDLKDIGTATAEQMKSDIAAIMSKFSSMSGQTAGQQMSSWFGGVTGYQLPGANELQKYIDEATAAGGALGKEAKAAQKELEQLAESGRNVYRSLDPVADAVAGIHENITALAAASLLSDETRSILGAQLWRDIADLGPAAIQKIIDRVAALDPAVASATAQARELAASLAADALLLDAQPVEQAVQQIAADIETLKAAGRMDAENLSILSGAYWRDFGSMAAGELDMLIERLNTMGAAGRQVAIELRESMLLAGSLDPIDAKQAEGIVTTFEGIQRAVSEVANEFSQLGANLGSTVVQQIGQVVGAIITTIVTYVTLQAAATAAATAATAAWLAILGPIYLVVAAINVVISLFGIFGKKAKEEITGVKNLVRELEQAMSQWVDRFADYWVDFLETGKFQFKDFIDSILKDLARLTAKLAMQEIISGLTGISFSKRGNVFDKGDIVPFRRGGVVSEPSFFAMPKGRLGMMAEQDEEDIFLLRRDRSGNLGVIGKSPGVVVNVIDQRQKGERVQVTERTARDGTRQLQITIRDAIESIAAEGGLNRAFRLAGVR